MNCTLPFRPERLSIVIFFLILSLLAGCGQASSAGGVSVWIDVPVDGLKFPQVQAINIEGHAAAAGSVNRVEIWVNGELLTVIDNPPMQGRLASFQTGWTPAAPGAYVIQVVAFSADGAASDPDLARVTFGEAAKTPESGCPTPVGGGPTPVSCDEPVGSGCPTPVGGGPTPVSCNEPVGSGCPTPVGGGPTPVSCVTQPAPPPGAVIQFWADPPNITAGACTNIRWHVENASRVVFGGIEKPFDGSYRDCLCTSTRYTLRVTRLDNIEETRTVDVAVSGSCTTPTTPPPPADTTPPPAPIPAVPADGLTIDCKSTQTLAWLPVTDPSGIVEYQVQVQRQSGGTKWKLAPNGELTGIQDKQVSIPVECGWYYRWRVRAVDGAGNVSPWSEWWQFVIPLT